MAVKESMSIYRALRELKTLDKRISDAMYGAKFVGVRIGEKPVSGYKDDAEFDNLVNSKHDSVTSLIKRRNAIKGAVVVANATTPIKVGNVEMTIATAIERKDSISYDENYLNLLRTQYAQVLSDFQRKEDAFKSNLDRHLETLYGKEGKANASKEALKPFLDLNEPKFVDPLNLKNVIDKLQEEITLFKAEVDVVLGEANIKTEITFEY